MKHHVNFLPALAFVLFTATSSVIAKQDDYPEFTVDGLQRVPDSKLAVVYVEPGADLAQYNRVLLIDAYVAFKKNWERDQRTSLNSRRVTSKDVENIKNDLSSEFQAVFRKTLEDGGYEVVDEPGDDVLLVRPAIINLDVNAPDTLQTSRTVTYAQSAGEMTLYIELYDSVTGDLIAKALDRKADHQGNYIWTNSMTNKRAAEKILQGWASVLLKALDEARQP
jgi:hypothetical protein